MNDFAKTYFMNEGHWGTINVSRSTKPEMITTPRMDTEMGLEACFRFTAWIMYMIIANWLIPNY